MISVLNIIQCNVSTKLCQYLISYLFDSRLISCDNVCNHLSTEQMCLVVSHMDTTPHDQTLLAVQQLSTNVRPQLSRETEYEMSLFRIEYLILEICKLILTNLLIPMRERT